MIEVQAPELILDLAGEPDGTYVVTLEDGSEIPAWPEP